MSVSFKKIFEHDMDLLIIEEFLCDRAFAKIFLDKIGLPCDYIKCDAYHSMADADGESDITVVLHYGDKKYGVLIEDKIDAPTMEEQSNRYKIRAEHQKASGMYDDYSIFIAAPKEYMEEHQADGNADYKNRVTYEELLAHFERQSGERAAYKSSVVQFALVEKKKGYIVDPDAQVSAFWKELRRYCEDNFSGLDMLGADRERGAKSRWPDFRSALQNVKIIYKSDQGVVDLELSGYGDKISFLQERIGHLLENAKIYPTGKSASIRLKKGFWKVDFKEEFSEHVSEIHDVLLTVEKMHELSTKIAGLL
ncbi:MAG: PD-(D/E)XK nuclease family protein [Clostridia bacterium]|nr:PD-(D/E)XK nuclease family protein [Clostridia bacterium]